MSEVDLRDPSDLGATASSINSDRDVDRDGDYGFDSSSSSNRNHNTNAGNANANGGSTGTGTGTGTGVVAGEDEGGSGDEESVVKSTDMPDLMQQHAVTFAADAIKQAEDEGLTGSLHSVVSRRVKKEFDAVYGPVWHCVVGRNFGSFVVHQSKSFIYFYVGPIAVLLFKSG